ncbi:MAG: hypothetical protein RL000_949, partial [Bacteroidota bacterium]
MLEVLTLVLVAAVLILSLVVFFRKSSSPTAELQSKITELEKGLQKIETALREDFRLNRDESARVARENRTELTESLTRTGKEQADKLEALISKIEEKNRELR